MVARQAWVGSPPAPPPPPPPETHATSAATTTDALVQRKRRRESAYSVPNSRASWQHFRLLTLRSDGKVSAGFDGPSGWLSGDDEGRNMLRQSAVTGNEAEQVDPIG
eukprot:4196395-Prymnesium_polylepis.4